MLAKNTYVPARIGYGRCAAQRSALCHPDREAQEIRVGATNPRPASCRGFTLLEVLVSVTLLAIAMAITFGAYYNISRAWQRGVIMADNLNHGDFIMEQLVNGLRCAFYPPPQSNTPAGGSDYGFWLEKNGGGPEARDVISWVKNGAALLGPDNDLYRGLHRVRVSIEDDNDDRPVVASRAWRPFANLDSFSPEEVAPFYVSGKVQGLSCRVSTNLTDEGWEWEESWTDDATNHLPLVVEITLYLDAIAKDESPVEIKRLVEIPVAQLSLQVK